ncbi:MAG: hypothetical protein AAF568_05800 [Pseudomonadota bacterium]
MHRAALLAAVLLAGCEGEGLDLPEIAVPDLFSEETAEALAEEAAPAPVESSELAPPAGADLLPTPGAPTPQETDPDLALNSEEQQIAEIAANAPHIYLAVQEDGGRPTSLIFAIDEARDGTPSNDPAIRLTPDAGQCNPQVMRSYNFPALYDGAPVFSGEQILRGVRAEQLPAYMAIAASNELLRLPQFETRDDVAAHNICTRKFWEAQLANPVDQG